jgi:predicted ABC-type ATPase
MSYRVKRLRIFAGPNGSGKSTLYEYLVKIHAFNSYFHINADNIAKDLPLAYDMNNLPISFNADELNNFLDHSPFQSLVSFRLADAISIHGSYVSLKDSQQVSDSYLAAALSEWIRHKILLSGSSFSFETVFSHPSKIDEIKNAKKSGYKIYLYFISSTDPSINLERVRLRVKCGGHDVPEEKIRMRYFRTMENLYGAFLLSDRAFLFDNSTQYSKDSAFTNFAEKYENTLYLPSGTFPAWFNTYLLEKLV